MTGGRGPSTQRAAGVWHARVVVVAASAALLLVVVQAVAIWTSSRARAAHTSAVDGRTPTSPPAPRGAPTPVPSPTPSATVPPTARPIPTATPRPTATAGAAPSVRHVVGLGDSVPAGTNCDCTPYVDLVAARLGHAQGTTVSASDLAVAGQTSSGLLAQLSTSDVRRRVRAGDLIVVTIGANDFDESVVSDGDCDDGGCYAADVRALRATLDRILATVRGLAGDDAQVVVTGYWNVFLDGAVGRSQGHAYVENSDRLTRAANAVIEETAHREKATYVDVYAPFKGDGTRDDTALLANDGDHPSARGHRVIATAITRAVTTGSA